MFGNKNKTVKSLTIDMRVVLRIKQIEVTLPEKEA